MELLLIIVLLFVFAPLWIALVYLGWVALLYLLASLVAGILAAGLILLMGGVGWAATIGGLLAGYYAAKGVAHLRADNSTGDDTT